MLIFFFLVFAAKLVGQDYTNLRSKNLLILSDTTKLDSLSIIPQSVIVLAKNGKVLPKTDYKINYAKSLFISRKLEGKNVTLKYRVFPINFAAPFAHKTMDQVEQEDPGKYDFFTLREQENNTDIFSISGLNKNGSISRGVSFGNNQDLSVSSNLDLQLSGKVTDDINIQAAVSDKNLPIQPEGNTQQLQEFDRVFIRLYNDKSSLIAGDFLITRPKGYFMNLNKKLQGGGFSTEVITHQNENPKKQGILKTSVNAAVSRGKFSRNLVNGVEGNQGPYQLRGDEGETFIIVLSGTERVYVNGKLMKRGQDNDYVIDYNAAELTFTPNQIITKDQRIVVEFQYSERNYGRSLFFVENNFNKDKLSVNFNIYSEQDNKNQPLQQELSEQEKRLLSDVGDNLNEAIISGIDTSEFIDDQVLYKLTDTLGFQGILVYSINPDSAKYRARFSLVGENAGNYRQIQSNANGRVFQWIQPLAGVPQGDYEPVIVLITPKQRQLITLGAEYEFSKNTQLTVEGAFSNNDVNTFSSRNSEDDQSYGMLLDFKNSTKLTRRDSGKVLRWNNSIFYEQIGRNFQFIERYRNVEFQRDWNIQDLNFEGNEYITKVRSGIASKRNFLNYEFSSFTKGSDYEGIRNGFDAKLEKKGFTIDSKGSYLKANTTNNSEFLRHYSTMSQKVGAFKVGAYLEQERILFFKGETDTINNGSFDRVIWRAFIEKGDSSSANFYRLSYSEIYDWFPNIDKLNSALKSENFGLEFKLSENRKSQLKGKVTYRRLLIQDDELAMRDPENTLLGRLEYSAKALKGFMSSNTFYQIGSGLENRREFSFLKVNDGQGTHIWIDFNNNDVKELNEFEVAGVNNAFQANYIKVFTPTTDFIRVFSNQFNQVLFLRPAAILKQDKKWTKVLAKFSNKATYRAERKTQLEEDIYNPFNTNVQDSSLISINSSFANTFYFNRLNPKFGVDYYFLDNRGKSLLTNGFETRSNRINELKARYNISRIYSIENRLTESVRDNGSEFFTNRNYTIQSREVEPKLIYQPTVNLQVAFSGIYAEKQNIIEGGTEESINQTASGEIRYSQAGKGSFSLNLSYVKIDFNSESNSSLAYEMLEGLQPGNNLTWNIAWQRNLSNSLQLNLTYGGRNSEEVQTIHTGGMQIRAFF